MVSDGSIGRSVEGVEVCGKGQAGQYNYLGDRFGRHQLWMVIDGSVGG